MIYQCQYCGRRINERKNNEETPEKIGKCLLYNNKAFCSNWCIEQTKRYPYVLSLDRPYFDHYAWSPEMSNWKRERKIGRKRKMRKLYRILNLKNV